MKKTAKGIIQVDGHEITVTNPDKLLWPDEKITKAVYLQKLLALSPYLLTYCRNRYMTTIRYPHGIGGESFYQKNAPEPLPPFVKTANFQGLHYVNLDSVPTLLWLGNLACLEFHTSFHRIEDPLPAEWILDIDPSLEVEPRIMQAVHLIGEVLDGMKIRAVPKTSGATGVQIVIPVKKGYTFDQLRSIGHFIGKFLVSKHPKLFTVERLKKNRGDLIYIDYLQHYYGKSMSSPYTPRARPRAPVSTPLTWEEVEEGVDPRDFNLLNIEERLKEKGDLLAKEPPQSLDPILSFIR